MLFLPARVENSSVVAFATPGSGSERPRSWPCWRLTRSSRSWSTSTSPVRKTELTRGYFRFVISRGSGCSTAGEHTPCNREDVGSNAARCWLFSLLYYLGSVSLIQVPQGVQHYWFSYRNKLSYAACCEASLICADWANKIFVIAQSQLPSWTRSSQIRSVLKEPLNCSNLSREPHLKIWIFSILMWLRHLIGGYAPLGLIEAD